MLFFWFFRFFCGVFSSSIMRFYNYLSKYGAICNNLRTFANNFKKL